MHEVEIGITHCGICHSDLHLISNDWGISQYPFIPGHEIIGTVTAVGSQVRSLKTGQRVGLGWQSNSCGECEWCTRGLENLCSSSEATCVHRHGGYANRVSRQRPLRGRRFPTHCPANRPLPCCAAESPSTTRCAIMASIRLRAWESSALAASDTLPFSLREYSEPKSTAFSTSAAKEEEARALGAHHFVNTRESKAMKEVAGSLDFILDDRQRRSGLGCLYSVAAAHRNAVFRGRAAVARSRCRHSRSSPAFAPSPAAPSAAPNAIREMLDVAARHDVKATTEAFPMAKANEAIEKVKKNKVRYRAVLAN